MGSIGEAEKPHAVCIPYPAQGHVNPMLKFAKLLHAKGFHITFVNTEYNHERLLKSRGPHALDGLPSFQFATIPDGLPPSPVSDVTQDIPSLCQSTANYCSVPFKKLVAELNQTASENSGSVPPVSCIVSDGVMSFTLDAAEEFGLPEVLFWTPSACGLLGYAHYQHLVDKGFTPLKDESYLTNGYLERTVEWIPGMKDIRLKDLPSFIRTTNSEDIMLNFLIREAHRAKKASAIIINTFDALEGQVLSALNTLLPPVYPIGPLQHLVTNIVTNVGLESIGSNLWKEDRTCIEWLNSKEPNSVVYVNFGSITVMTGDQLVEFAYGLANSNQKFLWVIRPDLVVGDKAMLPTEFVELTKERGLLISWCPQAEVLNHTSVGGFLTHNGWNSTLESLCSGVPMICWPFFAEQQTNCHFCCCEWGVGMEINSDVKREEVRRLVVELMEGEKGKEMKRRAMEWKNLAFEAAASPKGSSYTSLDNLIKQVLLSP